MKRFFMLIVAMTAAMVMSAQTAKVLSKVELKGGADVIGYAELQSDGGYVVETESGDVFYYSAAEIKSVTLLDNSGMSNEKVKVKSQILINSKDRSKSKGYMGIVEVGLGFGSSTYTEGGYNTYYDDYGEYYEEYYENYYAYESLAISLSIINGYRFSPHFYLGVGLGISVGADISLPVFLHLRSEFTKKRFAPYVALSAGYDPLWEGVMGDLSLGLRVHCKGHGSMWYGLTYGGVSDGYNNISNFKFSIAYSF